MKALLIHADRDLELRKELTPHEQALVQDLQLETVVEAMAGGDELVQKVSRDVLISSLRGDVETILYRQEILRDCLDHPDVVRAMYQLAGEALEARKKLWFYSVRSRIAELNLHSAIDHLELLSGMLRKLRGIADENADRFRSTGFTNLFATLRAELGDDYLAEVDAHLSRLKFRSGIPVSARLGESNEGTDYVLHLREEHRWEWLERLLGKGPPALIVRIPDRDEAGARALSELRERALSTVANAVAQSSDHVVSFFEMLRTELAFYVGGLNLHARLVGIGVSTTFPAPAPAGERRLHATGLCDVGLALGAGQRLVPNDLDAQGKAVCIITGANQGGKSSFLRGVGLAQLMMHAGLFVAAESCAAEVCDGIFTHFRREEDASMRSGKFDEEMSRMSTIVDALSPNAMVLFNESFGATNEREGSEIARQVVSSLLDASMKVFFVTHLYDFPHDLSQQRAWDALFLRAERREDGTRTFKLVRGEALDTSYGQDVYREVFGTRASGSEAGTRGTAQAGGGSLRAAPPSAAAVR